MKQHKIDIDILIRRYLLDRWKEDYANKCVNLSSDIYVAPGNRNYLVISCSVFSSDNRLVSDFTVEYFFGYSSLEEFKKDIEKLKVAFAKINATIVDKIDYSKGLCNLCGAYVSVSQLETIHTQLNSVQFCSDCKNSVTVTKLRELEVAYRSRKENKRFGRLYDL